jgi:hypothetical protein
MFPSDFAGKCLSRLFRRRWFPKEDTLTNLSLSASHMPSCNNKIEKEEIMAVCYVFVI